MSIAAFVYFASLVDFASLSICFSDTAELRLERRSQHQTFEDYSHGAIRLSQVMVGDTLCLTEVRLMSVSGTALVAQQAQQA